MRILAIDGSGLVASVAITDGGELLGEYTTNFKKTHSETLLPMVDALVSMLDVELASIDAIAVAGGPGSFTGLRIAAATAKGLGMALNKPIISVPTVDGMAYNMWSSANIICPIMDARRGQVYTGLYKFDAEGNMITVLPQCADAFEHIAQIINDNGCAVTFLGDGVPVFRDMIAEIIKVPYSFAPAHMNRQRASAIAALAEILYANGEFESAAEHRPIYLRQSQAERELAEKEQANKQMAEGN